MAQDMVQCGMAVAGYPNMDNVPPAENYSPPQVAVPPMVHHHQQQRAERIGGPPSPNYPPPRSPNPPVFQSNNFRQAPSPTWSTGPRVSSNNLNHGYSSVKNMLRGLTLETGTWYPVYISSIEEGPAAFSVQLQSLTKKLEGLMSEINNMPLSRLPISKMHPG